MAKNFGSSKTKLLGSLLACSLISLGAVATISFAITSCSRRTPVTPPNPIPVDAKDSSFYILSSNTSELISFNESNTPISNFCAPNYSGYPDNWIEINNSPVNINDIYALNFGSSYSSVTSIGDKFIWGAKHGFKNLVGLGFGGLSSLSSVGNDWMDTYLGGSTDIRGFDSLIYLDFSGLSSLKSVGSGWMDGNNGGFSSLTSIDISSLTSLSSVGSSWLSGEAAQGGGKGFQNVKTFYVGNLAWQNGFSNVDFCNSWPTDGTIYGSDFYVEETWLNGGIEDWHTSHVV